MKIIFIQPSVGKKPKTSYSRTWCMEPLSIAVLSAITPAGIQKVFYDDRIEAIPYDEPTDLVAITVETYTARRAYQIAHKFKSRNIKIVMGGFHASLATDEVSQIADSVVVGEAELLWPRLLDDFGKGVLQKIYQNNQPVDFNGILPDREIFRNKKYLKLGLVETSRGCYYHCEFCSIYGFYNKTYRNRPVADIIDDIKVSGKKYFFFVDDNLAMEKSRAMELCKALIPLKIKWFGQVSIHISHDEELLQALKESGCVGVLIGFESFNQVNLHTMSKNVNLINIDYKKAINKLRKYGLMIYGTFVFGYPDDTREDFERVLKFAIKNKLYMNAFNHLVPFPGTPMYKRLRDENRLIFENWWLMDSYKFGDVVFNPGQLSANELTELCYEYRKKFFTWYSIFFRGLDFKANFGSLKRALVYFFTNLSSRKDVEFRQGLPMGAKENQDKF